LKPEVGDKPIEVTRRMVADAVREVGVRPGDTAIFHSSLSSMGRVVGGPDTLIDGFLDAVGPDGTVACPSLWGRRSGGRTDLALWDKTRSPAYIGKVPDHFWRRPDALRSDNPTHAVAAIGARAEELAGEHGNSGGRPCCFHVDAFGTESPWQRLYDWNAAYCFIGVDFTVDTMRHFVESLFVERALADAPADRRESLRGRLMRWETEQGVWPHHNSQAMGERFEAMGLVSMGRIGSATLRMIRSGPMVDAHLRILTDEPKEWLDDEFLVWLDETKAP